MFCQPTHLVRLFERTACLKSKHVLSNISSQWIFLKDCLPKNLFCSTAHLSVLKWQKWNRQQSMWSSNTESPQRIQWTAVSFILWSENKLSVLPQWTHTCIFNSVARAARKTHSCLNQIICLDSKIDDKCILDPYKYNLLNNYWTNKVMMNSILTM